MGCYFGANFWLFEDVHSLNNCRIIESQILCNLFHIIGKCDSLEHWTMPMQTVTNFVQAVFFLVLELARFVKGIRFKEKSDLVTRIQEIIIFCLKNDMKSIAPLMHDQEY